MGGDVRTTIAAAGNIYVPKKKRINFASMHEKSRPLSGTKFFSQLFKTIFSFPILLDEPIPLFKNSAPSTVQVVMLHYC